MGQSVLSDRLLAITYPVFNGNYINHRLISLVVDTWHVFNVNIVIR